MSRWRVFLGLTMIGAKGAELDWSAGTVDHTINGHDSVTVTCSRASLDGVERRWWSARSGCLIVTYEDDSRIERIISACLISEPPIEDRDKRTVTFKGKGAGWALEGRTILTQDYTPSTVLDLRKTAVAPSNRAFSAIAAEIVYRATRVKRNGYLPIILPSRSTTGGHERTYDGWNLANNQAWKRLEELTQVEGGPDLAFRPEWADAERTRFAWRLIVGTDEQQTLPQDRTVYWDGTVPGSDVASIDITTDSDMIAHRVYGTGSGEGAGIALAMAEAKTIPEDMPLVETVIADSDAEGSKGMALLAKTCAGQLRGNNLDQVSLTINADPRWSPIGTWWCGELAQVVTSGWLSVPDGDYLLRMIACKYTLGRDLVEVECQEDALGEDYAW